MMQVRDSGMGRWYPALIIIVAGGRQISILRGNVGGEEAEPRKWRTVESFTLLYQWISVSTIWCVPALIQKLQGGIYVNVSN